MLVRFTNFWLRCKPQTTKQYFLFTADTFVGLRLSHVTQSVFYLNGSHMNLCQKVFYILKEKLFSLSRLCRNTRMPLCWNYVLEAFSQNSQSPRQRAFKRPHPMTNGCNMHKHVQIACSGFLYSELSHSNRHVFYNTFGVIRTKRAANKRM